MTQATAPARPYEAPSPDQPDPWRYGHRWVRSTNPNSEYAWEQVPLTLDDVMHPQLGDFVSTSDAHDRFRTYLRDVLTAHLAANPNAAVFSDLLIHWDVPDLRGMAPDIAVVFGLRKRREWTSFKVAAEGTRPSLVIEITSTQTRRQDLEDKVRAYAHVRIPFYFIVDTRQVEGEAIRSVLGYRLGAAGYEPLEPNEAGWQWMEPVGLWLGLRDEQVVCFDPDGNPLEDYTAIAAARATAERRAAREAAARAAAERRASQEAAARRAQAEARRAEAEARRAEAAARAEAEARLRDLEAELRRLRGEE